MKPGDLGDLPMILPVIDLKQGQVVRGVGGQRASYQPIESRLCSTAEPRIVARALVEQLGLPSIYVADLDALHGAPLDAASMQAIGEVARLWLDAGVDSPARATQVIELLGSRLEALIVALETLPDVATAAEILDRVGASRAAFSLDLRDGRPLVAAGSRLQHDSPERIVDQLASVGYQRVIVLDLAAVGRDRGASTPALCRRLSRRYPQLELISGGGVRDADDLRDLARSGCRRALVASALHDGRIDEEICRLASVDNQSGS